MAGMQREEWTDVGEDQRPAPVWGAGGNNTLSDTMEDDVLAASYEGTPIVTPVQLSGYEDFSSAQGVYRRPPL